jgi:hypothetical protein
VAKSYSRWESYQLTGRKWKQASTTGLGGVVCLLWVAQLSILLYKIYHLYIPYTNDVFVTAW